MSKGSFTVESAMVMGLVLTILLSVISYAGYLHDRAVLTSIALYYKESLQHMMEEPVAFDGTLQTKRLEEQNVLRTNGYGTGVNASDIERRFLESAGKRVLFSEVTGCSIRLGEREAALSYRASFKMRFGVAVLRLAGIETEIEGTVSAEKRFDPEEFIRLLRGLIWRKKK